MINIKENFDTSTPHANSSGNTINPTNEKIAQILMSLKVENDNKFVRGKKKSRENIERYLKHYYKMQRSSSSDDDYIIFVKYKDTIENESDAKNFFTDGDVSCDELNSNF